MKNKPEYQREYMKKYCAANKGKIECPCGGSYQKYTKHKHVKSKRHIEFTTKEDNNNALPEDKYKELLDRDVSSMYKGLRQDAKAMFQSTKGAYDQFKKKK